MSFYSRQIALMRQHLPKQEAIDAVIRARRLMDEQCSEAIDVDAMARAACLSSFHFIRLFKRCYGRTPHQLLTEARIKEAKRLLLQGSSVESACFKAGFTSVTSFATLFRRHTGRAPSVWRKMSNFR